MQDLSLLNNINKSQKLLSLDVSKRNIGLAISDTNLCLAFPFYNMKRSSFIKDMEIIQQIINKENIFALVIGMPFNGDGNHNYRTQSIKDFTSQLKETIFIPIFFQDERFSTFFIENNNLHMKVQDVDEKASAWFLQIFLDKIKNSKITSK